MTHRGIIINIVMKDNIETIYDNRQKNTTLNYIVKIRKYTGNTTARTLHKHSISTYRKTYTFA